MTATGTPSAGADGTRFRPLLDDLIAEAWERCGKDSSLLTGDVARGARRSATLMLYDWSNAGVGLWRIASLALTATPGVPTLALTESCADLLDVSVTVGQVDFPCRAIGRGEYSAIPVKSTAGRPTQYWVERIEPAPVLHLYPTPDQAYALTAYQIRLPDDVAGYGAALDLPRLWAEAAAAEMARRLALKYAPDRYPLLKQEAAEALGRARAENAERVPLILLPTGWGV